MLTQMIHRDWNRASVIIWSIGNETPFSDARMDFMIDLKQTAYVLDSSRLISAALLAVPGASRYFLGGGVVYTAVAREQLLGINFDDYPGIRSSSEPYAELAASTIKERLGADWGLAETGAAGPSGNRYGDAAGHTCIAINGRYNRVCTLETNSDSREENMWQFASEALTLFKKVLSEAN